MKRMFKMLVMTLVMAFAVSTATHATNLTLAQQLQNKLLALGVPNSYIGNVVEYLQKVNVSQADADKVTAKIDEVSTLVAGQKDISKLDDATKQKVQGVAKEAASVLGLNLSFGKDSKGATSATLTDASGKTIAGLSTTNVVSIVTNLDLSPLKDAVKSAVAFSNSPDKGKFNPVSGQLNNTGSNAGNVALAGLGLMGLAGAAFVGSKKVFA